MKKRKLKINILDIAILIVVICSVAALFFQDTITDIFGKPEVIELDVALAATELDTLAEEKTDIATAEFVFADADDSKATVTVASISKNPDGDDELVIKMSGYYKLGRYFSESGEPLSVGEATKIEINGETYDCVIKTVNKAS